MSDKKKKRKKKRSPAELLAAKKRELEKLEERVKRKQIENAIESGKLSETKEKEFKTLKRKASTMHKAAVIFKAAGDEEAVETAHKLESRFNKAMSVMVDEADEGSDEGSEEEEYEEGDGEEESDEEYEDEDEDEGDSEDDDEYEDD